MKKMISLALAASMVASMAMYASAANTVGTVATGMASATYDTDEGLSPVVDAIGPYAYDSEYKLLTLNPIEYGDTAFYLLLDADGKLVSKSDAVSSMKAKASWEEGSKLVDGLSIVRKKLSNVLKDADVTSSMVDDDGNPQKAIEDLIGDYTTYSSGDGTTVTPGSSFTGDEDTLDYSIDSYYYMLAIDLNNSSSTSDADLIGTVTLNRSKNPKVKDLDLDISLNVNWARSYLEDSATYTVTTDVTLDPEKNYSLKFESDEDVELNFTDDSVFTVDVSGQGKLLVYYDTSFDSTIANKYPEADLNFWNGNGAKFNRTGEMFLSASYDYNVFLYQVNDDGTLSKVANAEYDDSDEGFYFKTRVLGRYVISDMELDLDTVPSVDDVVVDVDTNSGNNNVNVVVPSNPNTGARV